MKWVHLSLFVTLMTLIALGQLQRLNFGPFTAVYLHDLVLVGWVGLLVATNQQLLRRFWTQGLTGLKQHKAARLLLAVIGIGWLTAAATQTLPLWTILFTLRLGVYLGWGYLMYHTKVISAEWWQLGFLTVGLSLASLGLLQYFLLPDTRFLSILGWDDHYYRLISTQFDPNFTGLLLAIALFWWWETPHSWWQWLVHGLSASQLNRLHRVTTLAISVLLLIAIGLTFSRASWLALVVGSLVLLKPKWNWALGLAGLAFLAVVILIMPKATGEGNNLWRTSTIAARLHTSARWLDSLRSYQLVVGRGLFVPPAKELSVTQGIEADHANLPDNLILLMVSGLGIAGTFTLLYLVATSVEVHQIDRLTLSVLAMVTTHSMFNNSLLQPFVLLFVLGTVVRGKKVIT
jgi:hypothetical protein